jgi:hypothetical protein
MRCGVFIVFAAISLLLSCSSLFAQHVYNCGQIDVQVSNPDGTPARRGIM